MTGSAFMKKWVAVPVIAVSFVALASYIFYTNKDAGDFAVRTSGIVEGIEVNLSSKAAGKISEICCNEGDMVSRGQVVIRLEGDDLRASVQQAAAGVVRSKADVKAAEASIENSRADINSAEAEIKSIKADVEKARVQREEAKRETDRAEALYKKDFISREALDRAASGYDSAVAAYNSSEAKIGAAYARKDAAEARHKTAASQLTSSKARLTEAEANLAFNRSRFNDTAIITPVSGTVIFKALEKGETVSPGITILTIVDLNDLYVRADIDETRIGAIALNGEAVIRVEGLPGRVFQGWVKEIGRYAEFATQRDVTRGRQDIKTFRVKIKFVDPAGLLKPGMTVEAEIPTRAK